MPPPYPFHHMLDAGGWKPPIEYYRRCVCVRFYFMEAFSRSCGRGSSGSEWRLSWQHACCARTRGEEGRGAERAEITPRNSGERGGGGGVLDIINGCIVVLRMTVDPRIPTIRGRSTSGFLPTRQTLLATSAKRREVLGECA